MIMINEIIYAIAVAITVSLIIEYINRSIIKSRNSLEFKIDNNIYNLDLSKNINEDVKEILSHTANPKIFLDYSFKDKEFAERLAMDLEKNDIRTWLASKEIYAGEKLLPKIEEGLRTSGYFLAIVSNSWLKSNWTRKELEMALRRQQKGLWPHIIPILIEDVDLPNYIKDRKYVDFRNDYEMGVEGIVDTIKHKDRL